MSLAVVGSRTFSSYDLLKQRLDQEFATNPFHTIVSGGADGADSLAARYAKQNNINLVELRPDYSKGRYAPLLRNTDIVNASDRVIAFWDGKSPGTNDTIKKTRRANKPLIIVPV